VKRDDLTGLALGGNKVRKLEYLVAEAQAVGARTLLTFGAVQSNHCRQTAAAAARANMDCVLVLGGSRPARMDGNVLLDSLFGAELVWAGERDRERVWLETFERLWAEGRRPHRIPYGGSNAVGAAAYAMAMEEFLSQGLEVELIVFASSSAGTQAGLVAGARLFGFPGRVLGISVDMPADQLRSRVAGLAVEVAAALGESLAVSPDEVEVSDRYCQAGYGVLTDLEREAIREFGRSEGLLLDPVYTGRAGGGLIDMVRRGEIGRNTRTLFWHTGGAPAIFAYSEQLTPPQDPSPR
jgi:D-cysteine desulfhydrase